MVNQVILQGRLTADIEVKKTSSDIAYTEFTVAWSDKYKESEKKCFLRCKAWRSTAEFLGRYFVKGQEIAVVGQMETEEWKKDGQKQSRTICVVEKVNFCGKKSEQTAAGQTQTTDENGFMSVPDEITEELPFK